MPKPKHSQQANTRQLARMLTADTSLTEGEKLNLARMLAGTPPTRKGKAKISPDWGACPFEDHAAARLTRAREQRHGRYRALYMVTGAALLTTLALVWAAVQWGLV